MTTSVEQRPKFSPQDVKQHKLETKYQGFFALNELQLSHRLYNGAMSKKMTREIFERGDAVVVMPYDPIADKVILQEQFRPGVLRSGEYPWLLEFVAGMFDADESPEQVAIREAKEEAGLDIQASDLSFIMKFFSSPGGTSESLHLFAARVDSTNVGGVFGLPEEGEDILLQVHTREHALTLLREGKITNATTIIGLQWLALNYQQLQALWQEK